MSGSPEPTACAGSLTAAVVPAARSRTKTSLAPPVSPGTTSFVPAGASNATKRPSALIAGRSVVPFGSPPTDRTEAAVVVPAGMSRTATSEALLPSPGIRLAAWPVPKAMTAPSAETSGSPATAAPALAPVELTETSATAPETMSLR
jgi:hypothetical protein